MEAPLEIVLLADLRSATPEIAAWLFREWGHRNPGNTLEQSIAKFAMRANVDRLPIAIVAVMNGKPVGTASVVETEEAEDEPGPWVSGVYVVPHYRGRGVATALMLRLEHEAAQLKAQRLLLAAAAPELYQRLGYRPTGAA